MKSWHFVGETLRDGRPVPGDEEKLVHTGPLAMCYSGLHASERIIDALKYAPGSTICRVECSGEIITDTDKMVCSERTILWRVDAENLLREFAQWCALSVVHLWEMPDVVRQYLETGDENLRAAARDAARAAARDAARAAVGAAAGDAARAAAWAAVWAAARDAARAAVGAAAWAAAWDAAGAAARAAVGAAAGDAARAAAWAAARAAAWAAQNAKLESMVRLSRSKP